MSIIMLNFMFTLEKGDSGLSRQRYVDVQFAILGRRVTRRHPACSLQTCLNKNTYSPEKCDNHLFALYECCQNLYKAQATGIQIDTTSCPQQSVVQRWMKKHNKD
jgi:Mature-T-Cell Proliferation I type